MTEENQDYEGAGAAQSLFRLPLLADKFMHIACLVFLVLLTYANTLNAPFQWDEGTFLIGNPIVKDLHYFLHPLDAAGMEHYDALANRYIGYLTFALNYHVHRFSVAGYHAVNISVHIANTILVYFLVLLTFRTPFMKASAHTLVGGGAPIAFFSAALFAVHPVQTEAVTYVFQRFASLVAFFYLLSLTAYVKSRLSEGRRQRLFYFIVSFTSAVLAMKTKENAFTLPLVVALYEVCFFRGPLKKRLLYLVPVLLTLLIIPVTLISLAGAPGPYASKEFSRGDYFFTQFRVIVTYLRLLFFPANQNIYYDYPVYHSFFSVPVFLSFIFLAALFGLGIYLVTRKPGLGTRDSGLVKDASGSFSLGQSLVPSPQSRSLRFLGFGILWFFITISVESSIIPIPMIICEYRIYLPSVGLIMSVVAGAFMLLTSAVRPSRFAHYYSGILLAILVLAIGSLSIATYLRNDLWGDKIKLWEDTAEKSPAKAWVHLSLGKNYKDSKMFDRAAEQYLIAIKLKPDFAAAHNNLAVAYASQGLWDMAIAEFQATLRLMPDFPAAHYNLGLAYSARGQSDKAAEEYQNALRLKPDFLEARQRLNDIASGQH
jgi:hypothetical protein